MVDRALSLHRAKLIDLFTSIELFEYNEVFDYEKSGSNFFFWIHEKFKFISKYLHKGFKHSDSDLDPCMFQI